MVDFVIEQGTQDIWAYRKWNSGVAECWGVKEFTLTQTGNFWWGLTSLPFTFIKTANSFADFNIIVSNNQYGTINVYCNLNDYKSATSVTSFNTAANNALETGTYLVAYYVKGRWK